MSDPQISVIIPVWNCDRYLRQAIESILRQDYQEFELIVIDDGSDDGSAEVAKSFAHDERVKIITQKNSGVVAARNAGLRLARAEFVAFLDADDIAMPSRLSKQLAFLRDHPDVAVVGSHITHFNDAEGELRTIKVNLTAKEVISGLETRNTLAQPSVMLRKSMAMAVGGYREAFKYGAEDYDLWLRLAEAHPLDNLDEVLTLYRIHPESLSHRRKYEQEFGALVAVCAHRRRMASLPDPVGESPTPLMPSDLARLNLSDQEESLFLPSLIGLLRPDSEAESYLRLTRRAWKLRRHIRPKELVRDCLAPGIFSLMRAGRNMEALGWLVRAFIVSPAGVKRMLFGRRVHR